MLLSRRALIFWSLCTLASAQVFGAAADWPVFHGNAALTGITQLELPEHPEVLWRFVTPKKFPFKASPVIAGGIVFVGSQDNSLYALNLADGKKIWSVELGDEIEGTPCCAEGKVFTGSHDSFIYAHDAKSGKELWKVKTGDAIKGGPNYVNGKVICGSYDNKLYCLDAATGKQDWAFETSNYINGTPAVENGITVFGGCDGLIHVLKLDGGTEIKSVEAGAYIAGSAALDGGIVYVGQHENEFLAANIESGKVDWSYKSPNGDPFDSTPAVGKDVLVVGCDDMKLRCLKRADGTEVWTFAAKGKIAGSPVIAGARVLFGDSKGHLYILDLKDGKQLWTYEQGSKIDSSPAIANNCFVITAGDGSVTAFGTKK